MKFNSNKSIFLALLRYVFQKEFRLREISEFFIDFYDQWMLILEWLRIKAGEVRVKESVGESE